MTEDAATDDESEGQPAPFDDRMASMVVVERRDELPAICGRIDRAPTFAVVIYAPDGNREMATELGMRRLIRHAEDSGRAIAIATSSRALSTRARLAAVPVSRRPEHVRWDAGGKRVLRLGPASVALPGIGRYAQAMLVV